MSAKNEKAAPGVVGLEEVWNALAVMMSHLTQLELRVQELEGADE